MLTVHIPIFRFQVRVNAYCALWLFCAIRAALTIYSDLNVTLKLNTFGITAKSNDVVVLVIWGLVSWICAKSILGQYGILKVGSFRQLFYNAFFQDGFQVAGIFRSLAVFVLTAMSAGYVYQMVHVIYEEWSTDLSPLLQTLQMYPALLMGFQTLYQGSYMLKCLINPDLKQDRSFHEHHQKSKEQLVNHIWLNLTFIFHSLCIFVVVRLCTIEPKIVFEMVTGEVLYRLIAAFMFWRVLKQVDKMGVQKSNDQSREEEIVPTACSEEEIGQEGPEEFVVTTRPFLKTRG